jgi:hypothetical protein
VTSTSPTLTRRRGSPPWLGVDAITPTSWAPPRAQCLRREVVTEPGFSRPGPARAGATGARRRALTVAFLARRSASAGVVPVSQYVRETIAEDA